MPKAKNNLKNKVEWLATLYEITKEVNSNLGLKRCLKSIIDNTVKLLNVERASLMILDKNRKELRIEYATGISKGVVKKARVKLGEGVSGWVAKTGRPLLINDISKDKRFKPRQKGKYYNQSLLSVPLKTRGEVIGVINVNNKRGKGVFGRDDLELLSALANEASIAVSNARLYQELLSANERLKELDELKSDFVANVSHELGTPLATCRYFSSLILNETAGPINQQQREYLQLMDTNIERLTRLINNLLSLSRIEAGRLDLRRTQTNIADLASGVLRTFQGPLAEKQISVENKISKDLPALYVDNERVIEVFTNLIGNAIKYSDKKSRITLSAEVSDKGIVKEAHRYLVLSVADTGRGIGTANLKKIFDKFEQLDKDGLAQKEKGTGLGLAICREIIRLHKGNIWAESELGKGSTFFFTLPVHNEEEYFMVRLSDEIGRARTSNLPLSLVALAIEDFVEIRKKLSKDEILGILFEVEAVAKKTVRRPNDVVIRFKKGEILAILADTDKIGAYALAGRVKDSLQETEFRASGDRLKLNFKIGVVTYPDDAISEIELLRQAEEVLRKKEVKL